MELESLFLLLPNLSIILATLYIPPVPATREKSALNDFLIHETDFILSQHPDFDMILCGDLNRFDISTICHNLSLVNCNCRPTYGEAELDYILLSDPLSDLYELTTAAPLDISSTPHLSLIASPRTFTFPDDSSVILRKVYDLRDSNMRCFLQKLSQVDWDFINDEDVPLNDKCSRFHSVLCDLADASFPASIIKQTPRDKPWITAKVKSLINARWEAFRCGNFPKYNHLKLKVRKEIKKAKVSWTTRMASKKIWTAVHSHLGTRNKNPINRILSEFNSIDEAVEVINQTLSSNFQHKLALNRLKSLPVDSWKPVVESYTVFNLLRKLDVRKSSFDIPNVLYKEAAPFIADALAHLFQSSINQRTVPNVWKISAVTPIPKVSRPTLDDIRPISILTTPAKLLEIIVLRSSRQYFTEMFDIHQFGFRRESSTLCALLSLDECVSRYVDDKLTAGVAVISYDLSKAFDKLPHHQIIQRLIELNFPNALIDWFSSYLEQRQQFVRIGVHSSSLITVTSGVPQGSVLGPILFVTTVSSYTSSPDSTVFKYADDTTICFPIYKQHLQQSMQSILTENEKITTWSKNIGLPINPKKSKCLTIKKVDYCPTPIIPEVKNVYEMKILGVTFNSKWNFDCHVSQIVCLASRRFYAMRVLKPLLSKDQLIMMYNAFIRSVIEYCAPLFLCLSASNNKRLNVLQNRFHRLICGKSCPETCLTQLGERRVILSLKMLRKIIDKKHCLHSLLPPFLPSGRFRLPTRRTEKRCKSFFPCICEMYNNTLSSL